jgi:hypothetical protein
MWTAFDEVRDEAMAENDKGERHKVGDAGYINELSLVSGMMKRRS